MNLQLFQIDAFAERLFEGNPAAVVPLEAWLDEAVMQAIAQENNLSETAFFVPTPRGFHLRWFTPAREVEMCGHATLASAFVIYTELGFAGERITFETLSGDLTVERQGERFVLDFPRRDGVACSAPAALAESLGVAPVEVFASDDYIAVLESEEQVRALRPDFRRMADLERRGVIATAPGTTCDFVCRFFAPRYGIDEDPVTGSAYTELGPYWSARLGKEELHARQISKRGGTVYCAIAGDRVRIAGMAVKYLQGEIVTP